MNEKFSQISLEVGGSHYPGINPNLQQKFGEAIVLKIMERIEAEIGTAIDQDELYAAATLQALALVILDDFDMEVPGDDDWDAEGELQKIVDEFDMSGHKNDPRS